MCFMQILLVFLSNKFLKNSNCKFTRLSLTYKVLKRVLKENK